MQLEFNYAKNPKVHFFVDRGCSLYKSDYCAELTDVVLLNMFQVSTLKNILVLRNDLKPDVTFSTLQSTHLYEISLHVSQNNHRHLDSLDIMDSLNKILKLFSTWSHKVFFQSIGNFRSVFTTLHPMLTYNVSISVFSFSFYFIYSSCLLSSRKVWSLFFPSLLIKSSRR